MSSEKDKSQNFNHLQVNMPEPCPGSRGSYPSPQSGAPTARRMERQRRGGWSAEGAIHYSLGRRPSGRRPRNAAVRVRPHNPARRRRGGWSAKGATYYSLGRRPSGRRPRKAAVRVHPTIRHANGAADGAPRARYIIAWVGGRQAAGPGTPRSIPIPSFRRANGARYRDLRRRRRQSHMNRSSNATPCCRRIARYSSQNGCWRWCSSCRSIYAINASNSAGPTENTP